MIANIVILFLLIFHQLFNKRAITTLCWHINYYYCSHSAFSINIFSTYRKSTVDPRSKDIIMKPFQSYMNDRNDNTGIHNMIVVTTTAPITSNTDFILFLLLSFQGKY